MSLSALVGLLAQEGGKPGLWNPTIIGVLTVLAAVGLFCGSVYLLLGTNLGGRLGFLVAIAGLSGFMVLLTTLWLTTPGSATGNSDLDPPHGPLSSWHVVAIVPTPGDSKIDTVRNIAAKGQAIAGEACSSKTPPAACGILTDVKPAIDLAVVPAAPVAGQTAPVQPFATIKAISGSTDYLIGFPGSTSYVVGGGNHNVFWHYPKYAVIEMCIARKDASGNNVIPPACDPLQPTQYAVLRKNLGSIRQPVLFIYWIPSLIIFGLSLLALHWWEQDERARKRAALKPVPTSTT